MPSLPLMVCRKALRILRVIEEDGAVYSVNVPNLIREFERATQVRRSVRASRSRKARSKAGKRESRRNLRAVVFARANGTCEIMDPETGERCIYDATDFAHVFGRGKGRPPESESNTLAACWYHHRQALTLNDGGGEACWRMVAKTLDSLGFDDEARDAFTRAEFCHTRNALPAAPETHPTTAHPNRTP